MNESTYTDGQALTGRALTANHAEPMSLRHPVVAGEWG
jgi:hypothetical protein